MQEIMAKNDQVTISDYYKSLSRSEKGQFIKFLIKEFDFGYSTLFSKLNGSKEFNPRDAVVINQVIEQGLWRQDK